MGDGFYRENGLQLSKMKTKSYVDKLLSSNIQKVQNCLSLFAKRRKVEGKEKKYAKESDFLILINIYSLFIKLECIFYFS